jgi:hypothetical protein
MQSGLNTAYYDESKNDPDESVIVIKKEIVIEINLLLCMMVKYMNGMSRFAII